MPTVISHGVGAILIGKIVLAKKPKRSFWFWVALCAMLPDADVLGFVMGVRYEDFWGHRGFSHSLVFAGLSSLLIVSVFRNKLTKINQSVFFWWIFFFFVVASHGVLDGLTNGGLGVAYFSPFDDTRYFFSWRPVQVSPIGIKGIFSARGVELFISEFTFLIAPLLGFWWVALVCRTVIKKLKAQS